ncbi:MAG TPA: putative glycolipid-binding domain-containing protein, partial [Amaricoccus sp.]|nr:putative glycolipid-binding domain-containing protein [Amaricoccus sp.]
MTATALWRRLDAPGHDAAILRRTRRGWSLTGTAVFLAAEGPACLAYAVDLDAGWRTRQGRVRGFAGRRRLDHRILRTGGGWSLDGVPVPGLGHLVDLDYSFTPATNLQQLRRVAPAVGAAVDIPVAWFDIGRPLTELPQRYERRGETSFWY